MGTRRWVLILALVALVATACGGGDSNGDGGGDGSTTTATSGGGTGDAALGEALYSGTCSSCHAPDATGLPGLGKALAASDFIGSMSDADLVAFIAQGRPASDPANSTGVDMPPKGGNPSLDDDDLLDIVAFLRTLQ